MENSCLCGLVESFKKRDMDVFPVIFAEFEGLIYKYSSRTDSDDTFGELSLFLVELLLSIRLEPFLSSTGDGLQRYIAVCLRNKYIALSKEKSDLKKESNPYFENTACFQNDLTLSLALKEALEGLTEKQRTVVVYRYIYLYSDSEIAQKLKISRQAVNRLINRALSALRQYFKGDF